MDSSNIAWPEDAAVDEACGAAMHASDPLDSCYVCESSLLALLCVGHACIAPQA